MWYDCKSIDINIKLLLKRETFHLLTPIEFRIIFTLVELCTGDTGIQMSGYQMNYYRWLARTIRSIEAQICAENYSIEIIFQLKTEWSVLLITLFSKENCEKLNITRYSHVMNSRIV